MINRKVAQETVVACCIFIAGIQITHFAARTTLFSTKMKQNSMVYTIYLSVRMNKHIIIDPFLGMR
jgi:hypothetical protein